MDQTQFGVDELLISMTDLLDTENLFQFDEECCNGIFSTSDDDSVCAVHSSVPLSPINVSVASTTIEQENAAISLCDKNKSFSVLKRGRLPRSTIPFKVFLDFPSALCNSFNTKDMHSLSGQFNITTHHKCLFRKSNGIGMEEFVGPDSLTTFFNTIMHSYGDAQIKILKTKTQPSGQFYIIKTKFHFTGSLMKELRLSCVSGNVVEATSADPYVITTVKLPVSVKSVMTLFIDSITNRIVLVDKHVLTPKA